MTLTHLRLAPRHGQRRDCGGQSGIWPEWSFDWRLEQRERSDSMGVIRVLPEDRIETLLRDAVIARLACCAHAAGARPYLVPLPCFYDGESLVALSGPGTKIRLMRANPLVTVEVDTGEASDRWASVVADGVYEEIEAPEERAGALATIEAATGQPQRLDAETILFRIRLTAKSGRYELPD